MKIMKSKLFLPLLMIVSIPVCVPFFGSGDVEPEKVSLPEGFKISVYAEGVKGARSLALSENGVLFVGSRGAGNVYALVDEDNDFKADQKYLIAEGLNMPNGVALRDGDLYVAEISKVWKFENIEDHLAEPPEPILINDDFPDDGHHGWKHIAFGPDGKLYVPVGAPCNICDEDSTTYSNIMRMNPDGSGLEPYVFGVRNTVGFDWHPETEELWFTDNGRDMMGDNIPPDELNRVREKGQHFGYPFCHGGDIPDPEYGKKRDCDEFTPPAQKLGPHVAALGMLFYTGGMFPERYKNQILICEHGSWNRSTPIGYRITLVPVQDNTEATGYKVFADGWLEGNQAWGRPVDIIQMPDGSVLVSDDYGDAVYRISYDKRK